MVNGKKTGDCGRKYLVSKQIAEKVRSVSGVVQKMNGPVTLEQIQFERNRQRRSVKLENLLFILSIEQRLSDRSGP